MMREGVRLDTLIKGCKRNELKAQHGLYKEFYSYGMSISIRYADHERDAISILNDAFMKVFKSIKTFDDQRPFKAWFRVIVVHTAIDHIKKKEKFKNEVYIDVPHNLSIAETISSKLAYEDILKMVDTLSTMYRTVFNMHVIDGYRHDEIASLLGISINTSKSNLSRAKSKLRSKLQQKLSVRNV